MDGHVGGCVCVCVYMLACIYMYMHLDIHVYIVNKFMENDVRLLISLYIVFLHLF